MSAQHFTMTSYETEKPVFKSFMRYLIYGKEVCPTTTREHWQCHFMTKRKMTLKRVIEKQKPHHIEISVAPQQSIEYCKKEGKWEEHGTLPQQGKRNDLITLKDFIMKGEKTVQDIMLEDPMMYHQYGRTLNALEDVYKKRNQRDWVPECVWLVGPTGVGKSRKVHSEEKSLYIYPYEVAGWWDQYDGEEAVLFDDFRGQLPLNQLLRICDRYAFAVPRRGRAPTPLLAKRIWFTSCKTPEQVYDKDQMNGDSIAQLLRRIKVVYMDGLDQN